MAPSTTSLAARRPGASSWAARFGNLYDRIVNGTVTDFVEVHAGQHYFPAFNVADSAITVGACLLLLDMWWAKERKSEPCCPKLISIGNFFHPHLRDARWPSGFCWACW